MQFYVCPPAKLRYQSFARCGDEGPASARRPRSFFDDLVIGVADSPRLCNEHLRNAVRFCIRAQLDEFLKLLFVSWRCCIGHVRKGNKGAIFRQQVARTMCRRLARRTREAEGSSARLCALRRSLFPSKPRDLLANTTVAVQTAASESERSSLWWCLLADARTFFEGT